MSTLYERLNELCKKRGVTGSRMCLDLGMSKSTMSELKSGRSKGISTATAQKFASYLGVSVGYLLGEEETEKAPDIKSNAILLDDKSIHMIPIFESVSAGFGVIADNTPVDYTPIHFFSHSEAESTICVKVKGDSMFPKIEDGDIIQIYKTDSVDSGTIAVMLLDGEEALVKKVVYGVDWIELHSINPMYPVMRFDKSDVLRLRVLGQVKRIIKNV